MTQNICLYDFILENINKIVVPEELIRLELSLSRYEFIALILVDKHNAITMGKLAQ